MDNETIRKLRKEELHDIRKTIENIPELLNILIEARGGDPETTLYSDSETLGDYTGSGDSPYVQSDDANYIFAASKKATSGDITFDNLPGNAESINTVVIKIETYLVGASKSGLLWVWDNSASIYQDYPLSFPQDTWQEQEIDVSDNITDVTEVNALKCYVEGPNIANQVRVDYVWVDVNYNETAAVSTAYEDVPTRINIQIEDIKDIAVRIRTETEEFKDTAVRIRTEIKDYKDILTRMRIDTGAFKDLLTRVRIEAEEYSDILTRVRVEYEEFQDILTRIRLRTQEYKDIQTRIRVQLESYKDVLTRIKLEDIGYKDILTRIRVASTVYKNILVQLKIGTTEYKDILTRIRTQVGPLYTDVLGRTRIRLAWGKTDKGINWWKDPNVIAICRYLSTEDGIADGISVYLNRDGTGDIHFKCALYSDDRVLLGVTSERTLVRPFDGWFDFPFEEQPIIVDNTYYRLASWSDGGRLIYYNEVPTVVYEEDVEVYNSFPNPYTADSTETHEISMYLYYTRGTAFDIPARIRIQTEQFTDILSRIRISYTEYKDVLSRIRLAATTFQDYSTRVRIQSAADYKDILARVKIRVSEYKDILTRIRTQIEIYLDRLVQLRLESIGLKDVLTRIRIGTQLFKDILSIVRIRYLSYSDIMSRIRIEVREYQDYLARLKIEEIGYKDILTRIKTQTEIYQDVLTRVRTQYTLYKDIPIRIRTIPLRYSDIYAIIKFTPMYYSDILGRIKILAEEYKDLTVRIRTQFLENSDYLVRVRSEAEEYKDISSRIRTQVEEYLDKLTRIRIQTTKYADILSSIRIHMEEYIDILSRIRIAPLEFRDIMVRIRTREGAFYSNVLVRIILETTRYINILSRMRIMAREYKTVWSYFISPVMIEDFEDPPHILGPPAETKWDNVSGVEVTTSERHHGERSGYFEPYWYMRKKVYENNYVHSRYYIKVPKLPKVADPSPEEYIIFQWVYDWNIRNLGYWLLWREDNGDLKFSLQQSIEPDIDYSAPISWNTNVWHLIEIGYRIDENGWVKMWYDGELMIERSLDCGNVNPPIMHVFGVIGKNMDDPVTMYKDCLWIVPTRIFPEPYMDYLTRIRIAEIVWYYKNVPSMIKLREPFPLKTSLEIMRRHIKLEALTRGIALVRKQWSLGLDPTS